MLSAILIAVALLQAPAQQPVPTPIQDEPLTLPAIVYPTDAKAARIQGTVHLEIKVDPTGRVTEVHALDGPVALRQAAIDAYTQATYRPLLRNNRPIPAVIATAVDFSLKELPPDPDMLVGRQFEPLHLRCQQLSSQHSPEAVATCRSALQMSQRFTPGAQLEARASAYNDLVLLLIAQGKKSPDLAEAASLADQAVNLVDLADKVTGAGPHKPAVALAYITRAEVRSLADNLRGAEADCAVAEETLNTLLQDQGKRDPLAPTRDETENERAGSYRLQLRDTLLLHAIVLDRDHKSKEAKAIRARAASI
jgi:TonB family protein